MTFDQVLPFLVAPVGGLALALILLWIVRRDTAPNDHPPAE
jgi:hypothetical protein